MLDMDGRHMEQGVQPLEDRGRQPRDAVCGTGSRAGAGARVSLSALAARSHLEASPLPGPPLCRGCMSVIARAPDGTIRVYCKGSDAKVLKKIRPGTDPQLLAATEHDLHDFAMRVRQSEGRGRCRERSREHSSRQMAKGAQRLACLSLFGAVRRTGLSCGDLPTPGLTSDPHRHRHPATDRAPFELCPRPATSRAP